jgi:hypothetical protein
MAGRRIRLGRIAAVAGVALGLLLAAPLRAEAHARLMGVLPAPSRVVLAEAGILLTVLVLAAVLGESQLPPLFNGRVLPGDAQDVVQSGLFGSGCQ